MICDKCGKEVDRKNDAVVIESIAFNNPSLILFVQSRHFLPENGCEGSPSRAQYIKGQPRDTRGYNYNPEYEIPIRTAYLFVLQGVESLTEEK